MKKRIKKTNDVNDKEELEARLETWYDNPITLIEDGDDTVYLHDGLEVARWHNDLEQGAVEEYALSDKNWEIFSTYEKGTKINPNEGQGASENKYWEVDGFVKCPYCK